LVQVHILPQDSGKKLHRYMRQALPGLPLSGVYKLLRVGRVKVNGKKGKMETILQPGDELTLFMPEEEYQTLIKPARKFGGVSTEIAIVYEDDHLLVVNKPVGLLTHPDATEHKDTLIGRALAYLHRSGELADGRSFLPATVNRLDRNTSGVVLIGKDGDTLRDLSETIRGHQLRKYYLTIVWGTVKAAGEMTASLVRDERTGKTLIASRVAAKQGYGGHVRPTLPPPVERAAITRYKPLGVTGPFTLLQVEIVSGRTHQIRAHMQAAGHPLLGDIKYGGKPAFDITHHLLHAQSVELPDGRSFVAPPSDEFMSVLVQSGLLRFLPPELPTADLSARE